MEIKLLGFVPRQYTPTEGKTALVGWAQVDIKEKMTIWIPIFMAKQTGNFFPLLPSTKVGDEWRPAISFPNPDVLKGIWKEIASQVEEEISKAS